MVNLAYPVIKSTSYSPLGLKQFTDDIKNTSTGELLLDYPTVYIIYKKNKHRMYDVYVGETNNIRQRTTQHLIEDPKVRPDWDDFRAADDTRMIVIGHDRFNKSLTLDIENKMMLYMSGVSTVQNLNNRRENDQNKYFTEEDRDNIFSKVWRRLRKIDENLFPVERIIQDSALFKASPFHKLTEAQFKAKDLIQDRITHVLLENEEDQLILVEGEAGSGKTVLLSTIFYQLHQYQMSNDHPQFSNLKLHLIVNHDEQLKVYRDILIKLGITKSSDKDVVSKATHFINTHRPDEKVDVVLVDEAHLLWTQGKQAYRGNNQLEDIMARARVTVAIFDPRQILKAEEYLEKTDIENLREKSKKQNNLIVLKNQLRMRADERTIDWIRAITDGRRQVLPIHRDSKHYDLRIFDDAAEMYRQIKIKNSNQKENGISRLVATFDWEYTQRKRSDGKYWMVTAGNLELPWNLQLKAERTVQRLAWPEQSQTIDEVGSTYTIQGFDLNYCGVIIGPSVTYKDGRVQFNPEKSKNTNAIHQRTLADGKKVYVSDELLANELNVLLTRGVNGLYIYAADDALREKLLKASQKTV
ncbi:DUF2075 domain-containing protein [Secundilactobacillus folii]|uniref:DUF2075 domain-containing protein n=1 Tax=Secundilactobacillus folii TaxID=2678357 RepID=A0A7X2XTZ5_9LACO|nr:DUF2075 domain-containing protein [Secundilactobacillus folii]MTV81619.1 DUF2075 domain-containing protein [Secundilactobacillus folii]